MPDAATREAMRWLYDRHGLRTEPSGAIAGAALLGRQVDLTGDGDSWPCSAAGTSTTTHSGTGSPRGDYPGFANGQARPNRAAT